MKNKTKFQNFSRLAIPLFLVGCTAAPGYAANIALFFHSSVVDTDTTVNAMFGGAGEAENLRVFLLAEGHSVSAYTDISILNYPNIIDSADLNIYAEEENGSLNSILHPNNKNRMQSNTCQGGGMIFFGDQFSRVRDILNFSWPYELGFVVQQGSILLNSGDAAVTAAFPGAAAVLEPVPDTFSFLNEQLPATATTLTVYAESAANPRSPVTIFSNNYGDANGKVLYIGYDWFGTPTTNWEDFLRLAITYTARTVPLTGVCTNFDFNLLTYDPNDPARSGLDTTAPVLELIGDASVSLSFGAAWVDPGVNAEDPLTDIQDVTVTITGTVNTASPGAYTITYNASDASGNQASPVMRTVTVQARQGTSTGCHGTTASGALEEWIVVALLIAGFLVWPWESSRKAVNQA